MRTNFQSRSLRSLVLLTASLPALVVVAEAAKAVRAAEPAGARLASAPVPAPAASELLQRQLAKFRSANTLQTSFIYTETLPGPLKDLRLQGKAVAKKPGNWRLEIARFRRTSDKAPWGASGNNTLSVSDGKTASFEFIHPHSSQLRQSPLQSEAIAGALSELGPLRAFFDEAEGWPWQGGGEPYYVEKQPGQLKGQRIVHIPLGVTPQDSQVYARVAINQDGQLREVLVQKRVPLGFARQEWTFETVGLGKPVNDASFQFRARPGAKPFTKARRSTIGAEVGDQAPDFTVRDRAGKTLQLSDLKGKTVVLDFWASWCWVCNQSFPATAALANKYAAKDVVFLAVAIQDSDAGLDAWLKRHSYPEIRFAIDSLPQGEDIASQLYGVKARPTHFVIDGSGKITFRHQGYDGKSDELEAAIQAALPK